VSTSETPGTENSAADSAMSEPWKLNMKERIILPVIGVILVLVGLLLWIFPASHQEAAPASAKCTDANTCWVEVEDAPELLLSSFVVLGALLVLVGINGRRLTKFAGPGVSFESEGAKAAETAAAKVAGSPTVPDGMKGVVSTIAAEKARRVAIATATAKQAPLSATEFKVIATDAARVATSDWGTGTTSDWESGTAEGTSDWGKG
jgi:hypothetical protein